MLVAPNAFKGSLSAGDAARALARGVRKAVSPAPLLRRCPVADGGDDTLDVLSRAFGARRRYSTVTGPRGRPLRAAWAYAPRRRVAIIEMAQTAGLALLAPLRRNPLRTTSVGLGMQLERARRAGARRIWVGLGGSATVDGGLGALQALGARVYLKGRSAPLARPAVGRDLIRLVDIDAAGLSAAWRRVDVVLLADVKNRLHGRRGAARAFGPQKGAGPRAVRQLEAGLRNLERVVRRRTGLSAANRRGAGAAGGAAVTLAPFLGARLAAGADVVLRALGAARWVRWADVVLTGEGRVDAGSYEGKALGALVRLCRRHRKPLIVFCGRALGPRPRGVRFRETGDDLRRGAARRLAEAVRSCFRERRP